MIVFLDFNVLSFLYFINMYRYIINLFYLWFNGKYGLNLDSLFFVLKKKSKNCFVFFGFKIFLKNISMLVYLIYVIIV